MVSKKEKVEGRFTASSEKGFGPTLFDCINVALVSTLGQESVSTFYYAIQETFHLPQKEFERKPLEMLQHLKEFLGVGYGILEVPILRQIKNTFGIEEKGIENLSITKLTELARRNYLHS